MHSRFWCLLPSLSLFLPRCCEEWREGSVCVGCLSSGFSGHGRRQQNRLICASPKASPRIKISRPIFGLENYIQVGESELHVPACNTRCYLSLLERSFRHSQFAIIIDGMSPSRLSMTTVLMILTYHRIIHSRTGSVIAPGMCYLGFLQFVNMSEGMGVA